MLGRVRLGALEGHAEGTVPDELRGNTKGTRNTEEDGVEVLLVETVVGEEDTRVGVDIGPGVWSSLACVRNTKVLNRDSRVMTTDEKLSAQCVRSNNHLSTHHAGYSYTR